MAWVAQATTVLSDCSLPQLSTCWALFTQQLQDFANNQKPWSSVYFSTTTRRTTRKNCTSPHHDLVLLLLTKRLSDNTVWTIIFSHKNFSWWSILCAKSAIQIRVRDNFWNELHGAQGSRHLFCFKFRSQSSVSRSYINRNALTRMCQAC